MIASSDKLSRLSLAFSECLGYNCLMHSSYSFLDSNQAENLRKIGKWSHANIRILRYEINKGYE